MIYFTPVKMNKMGLTVLWSGQVQESKHCRTIFLNYTVARDPLLCFLNYSPQGFWSNHHERLLTFAFKRITDLHRKLFSIWISVVEVLSSYSGNGEGCQKVDEPIRKITLCLNLNPSEIRLDLIS